MLQYKCYLDQGSQSERVLDAIDAVIESMERHTWYLDETLVILSLVDPDLEDNAKKDIAKVLLETPAPEKFQPKAKIDIWKIFTFLQRILLSWPSL